MTATFQPRRLASFCDGLEPVEVADAINDLSGWCEHAKRFGISSREVSASAGRYLTSDVVWRLDPLDWPTKPSVGSTITDSESTVYTVLSVAELPYSGLTPWGCTSRALEVVAGIDGLTLVTIQVANRTKDASGGSKVTWETEHSSVRAKITVTNSAINNLNRSPSTIQTAEIVLQSGTTINQDRLIVGSDGTVWQPTQIIPARLDSLTFVLATSSPAPNQ